MVCTKPALLPQARRRQQCKALLLTRNSKGSAGKRPTGAFQRSPCYFGGRFTPGRLFLSLCSVPKATSSAVLCPNGIKKPNLRFMHFSGSPKRSIRRPYFWAPDAIIMEPKVLQGQGSLAPLQESRGQRPLAGARGRRSRPLTAFVRSFIRQKPQFVHGLTIPGVLQ